MDQDQLYQMHRTICRVFKIRESDNLPMKSFKRTRDDLIKLMGDLGFKCGAEIGVLRGGFSREMCRIIPGLKLKCIDPWIPFGGTGEEIEHYYHIAIRRLRPYECEIIRKTSMDAVKDIPDGSLDFVYIDELHEFNHVVMDLIEWSKKVRPGGIVAGHDYSNNYFHYGVIPAVDAYTKAHCIYRWYLTNERDPSYFWVKI